MCKKITRQGSGVQLHECASFVVKDLEWEPFYATTRVIAFANFVVGHLVKKKKMEPAPQPQQGRDYAQAYRG